MHSQHVLPILSESFVLLVQALKRYQDQADIFELWLDRMKVKGDLAVIQKFFNKPMIAKSDDLDRLKRGVKAGLTYVDVPHTLEVDHEFITLTKNKGTQIIRSFHDFERTPSYEDLLEILRTFDHQGAHFLKIATHVNESKDIETLFALLEEPRYKGRLIITGMGELARPIRIQAPLKGSVFFYAPLHEEWSTAPGQLTISELQREWDLL